MIVSVVPNLPPWYAPPTRSPPLNRTQPSPTWTTSPTISCPGTRGKTSPKAPSPTTESVWQTPHASTLMRISPLPGLGMGRSFRTRGEPAFSKTAALNFDGREGVMVMVSGISTACSSNAGLSRPEGVVRNLRRQLKYPEGKIKTFVRSRDGNPLFILVGLVDTPEL